MGYHRAGFEVVGVDINPQPHYPFPFVQMDAMEYLDEPWILSFDAVHASPPCQRYSVANNIHGNTEHPDLVSLVRERLSNWGKPYVIENVPGAPLVNAIVLCGLSLGCGVKRHRLFESNVVLFGVDCVGGHPGDWVSVFGHTVLERSPAIGRTAKNGPIFRRKHLGTARGRVAMGIDWMTREELSEAIPPAYTEYLGRQLLQALGEPQRGLRGDPVDGLGQKGPRAPDSSSREILTLGRPVPPPPPEAETQMNEYVPSARAGEPATLPSARATAPADEGKPLAFGENGG